ncbi:hypothetical protein JOM56_004420 [Amanita muscaria]
MVIQIPPWKIFQVWGRRGNTTNKLAHETDPLANHTLDDHLCVKALTRLRAEIRTESASGLEPVQRLVDTLQSAIKNPANLSLPCKLCRDIAPLINKIVEGVKNLERAERSVERLCREVLMSLEVSPTSQQQVGPTASGSPPPRASQAPRESGGGSILGGASNVQVGEASFTNVNGNSESTIINNTIVVERHNQPYLFLLGLLYLLTRQGPQLEGNRRQT